ncbi:hypothetical protein MOD20_18320 [Bacillus licheniformis]|uniref:hypothetical protein n=1 Tax=Bacillus licheniformis TaxID=1402 RepID=UPI00227DF913|nr:hypothetical protein [Bacillus licheniformis]MCY8531032.1 hypothetical protein [Bacillus licheniformis]
MNEKENALRYLEKVKEAIEDGRIVSTCIKNHFTTDKEGRPQYGDFEYRFRFEREDKSHG